AGGVQADDADTQPRREWADSVQGPDRQYGEEVRARSGPARGPGQDRVELQPEREVLCWCAGADAAHASHGARPGRRRPKRSGPEPRWRSEVPGWPDEAVQGQREPRARRVQRGSRRGPEVWRYSAIRRDTAIRTKGTGVCRPIPPNMGRLERDPECLTP